MAIKVAVGMSGGVDSSVACALLLEQGFDVIGVTMAHTKDAHQGAADAHRVCMQLGIPHEVVKLQQVFEKSVVEPFIISYASGQTPNPCVECNVRIKFGALMGAARMFGADYFATGHYAQAGYISDDGKFVSTVDAAKGSNFRGRIALKRGVDRTRDQSYALYRLSREVLAKAMFPLGGLLKRDVRSIARERSLATADKGESQDICFIQGMTYAKFLVDRGLKPQPGTILDTAGNVRGKHTGLFNYTVGQRKGLGIPSTVPLYVVAVDPKTNSVVVGSREDAYAVGAVIERVNFLEELKKGEKQRATCMVRYRAAEVSCSFEITDDSKATVLFDSPQFAVTPGQSLVLYRGEYVLGGGIIAAPIRQTAEQA